MDENNGKKPSCSAPLKAKRVVHIPGYTDGVVATNRVNVTGPETMKPTEQLRTTREQKLVWKVTHGALVLRLKCQPRAKGANTNGHANNWHLRLAPER